MNTMEVTKVVAGVCSALLVFLLVKWGAEVLFAEEGGHGEEQHAAYEIEVEEDHGEAEVEEGPSFADLLAAADPAKGERVFGKCKACHSVEEGQNGAGPTLFGVVDRAKASVAGFNYSGALSGLGGNWTAEDLNGFLTKPSTYAAGTTMGFAGLRKEEDRADIIAYLSTFGG